MKKLLQNTQETVQAVRDHPIDFADKLMNDNSSALKYLSKDSTRNTFWRAAEDRPTEFTEKLPVWLLRSPRALQRCLAEQTYSEAVDIIVKVRAFRWNSKLHGMNI